MNVIPHSLLRFGLVAALVFMGVARPTGRVTRPESAQGVVEGQPRPSLRSGRATEGQPRPSLRPGRATERDVVTLERVEIGIGGKVKIGSWTPVTVNVTTSGPMRLKLSVEAEDPDKNPVTFPSPWTDVPAAGTHRLPGLFKCGRMDSNVSISVSDESGVRATRRIRMSNDPNTDGPQTLEQSVLLVAALGEPAGLDDLPADRWSVVPLESAAPLPTAALGYDGLDALVVAGNYDLGPQRSSAVREWVAWGGHLVLCVGIRLEDYEKSALADWVSRSPADGSPPPVPLTGPLNLRELSSVESFTGTSRPIHFFGRVPAVRIGKVRGEVLMPGLDGPLSVREPYGFGAITFLALDLNRPPLSTWESASDLVTRLIVPGDKSRRSNDTVAAGHGRLGGGGQRGQLASSGITDLASQLHVAQDDFPRVRRFSTWTVMGLFLLYLLLIGPADYFVVHRLLGRPRLTWITFPVLVTAAFVLAAVSASAAKGDRVRINQVDVIDIDEQSGRMRLQSWITLYSPQTGRYRVEVSNVPLFNERPQGRSTIVSNHAGVGQAASDFAPRDSRGAHDGPWIVWTGIPEESFGGMYRRGGVRIARSAYRLRSQAPVVEDLPVSIWSTKSLTAGWRLDGRGLVESSLEQTVAGHLDGTIRHRLPVPVEDWMLAYGNRVYRPAILRLGAPDDQLPPEVVFSPDDPTIQTRELRGYLTRTRRTRVKGSNAVHDEIQIEKSPYDPLDTDADDILRMLTFHQAAGGTDYTGLNNHLLRTHDLSRLLRLGRAVLFGRVNLDAVQLTLNGDPIEADQHAAFVRIVLPVRHDDTILRRLPKQVE